MAYLAWARALAVARSASEVTHFMFLTPFLPLVLGYVVVGEVPGPETFVGGAAILAGPFPGAAAQARARPPQADAPPRKAARVFRP